MITHEETIDFKLGEISGKLEQIIAQLAFREARDEAKHAELEARLRRVESRQHWYAGAAAAVVAAVSYVIEALKR